MVTAKWQPRVAAWGVQDLQLRFESSIRVSGRRYPVLLGKNRRETSGGVFAHQFLTPTCRHVKRQSIPRSNSKRRKNMTPAAVERHGGVRIQNDQHPVLRVCVSLSPLLGEPLSYWTTLAISSAVLAGASQTTLNRKVLSVDGST